MKVRFSITLDKKVRDDIDNIRDGIPRSAYINKLCADHVKRKFKGKLKGGRKKNANK